jgi:plasmid maintenance system antidote protein VapI
VIRANEEYNMVKNKMRPVHPGEILREEYLAPMGMSVHALRRHCVCRPRGCTRS